MFSIFRRKAAPEPLTFNARVDLFWRWFQEVAPRFYETIEAGKCASLADETSAKVDELLPGLSWVYGPGADGKGHSLTLTGEGVIHRQLRTLQWLSRQPKIEGWTFYAARQPGPIKGHVIEMAGTRFDPQAIWVTPSIDEEHQNVDITVWHPSWGQIDTRQQGTITFLFLDESLGEYGTDWWIGEIGYGKDKLAGSFPLEELAGYLDVTARERGWKKHPPGELWTLYSIKERIGGFPRSDIITQVTAVPRLFNEFSEAEGELADPLSGTGADYVYVSMDVNFFPKGKEATRRGEIEEAIDAALKPFDGGKCIGGACGTERMYCDFLIFDGRRSLAAITDTLKAQGVPRGTMIEYFAREKRGQRISIA